MKLEKWQKIALSVGGLLLLSRMARGSTSTAPGGTGPADVDYRGTSNPRGMRNNNPGNIKINSANAWQGKVPPSQNTDGTFEQFTSYKYGIRAQIRLLKNYIGQGNDTLSKIIYKYAPPSVDPSEQYLMAVVAATGINRNFQLSGSYSELSKIIPAMAKFENGKTAITGAQFDQVWGEFNF